MNKILNVCHERIESDRSSVFYPKAEVMKFNNKIRDTMKVSIWEESIYVSQRCGGMGGLILRVLII